MPEQAQLPVPAVVVLLPWRRLILRVLLLVPVVLLALVVGDLRLEVVDAALPLAPLPLALRGHGNLRRWQPKPLDEGAHLAGTLLGRIVDPLALD